MFRKVLLTVGLLIAANVVAFAQGTLKGTIINASTNEPEPFVNVVVLQNGEQKGGAQTDFDGNYTIKPLAPGNYDVKVSSVGFAPVLLKNVPVKASGFSYAETIKLETSSKTLEEVKIVEHKIPLVDKGNPESGQRVSKEDIGRMASTDVSSIVAVTTAGVGYSDGGAGTACGEEGMVTYVGNARKNTSVSVPKEAIEEIQVILGGTPARYGEAIGGTQIITLRPPSNQYHGSLNY
ncbi:MAG: carboxypeptidase-like regulatory domain-containing protein, partial [Bacteroidales bacterium]|nr:carboxypeptidase-like regulatory domain-containing protein [Bacteroidales bacterium]